MRRTIVLALLVATLAAVVARERGQAWFVARAADDGDRVAAARERWKDELPAVFDAAGVAWPPRELFLRAIKQDDDGSPGVVQVWAGDGKGPLALVQEHPICALSGHLGPKRREGDLQIPEGFYFIDRLNARSSYHLSMHVNYPNASDRIRGRVKDDKAPLGGEIMIHGSCVTIGCIPIEDGPIEQVYLAVAEVLSRGAVPLHIFPRRLDAEGLKALQATTTDEALRAFWAELAVGWRAFEETKRVPRVTVARDGAYVVKATGTQ